MRGLLGRSGPAAAHPGLPAGRRPASGPAPAAWSSRAPSRRRPLRRPIPAPRPVSGQASVEEELLGQKFGAGYEELKRRTKKLIPLVY